MEQLLGSQHSPNPFLWPILPLFLPLLVSTYISISLFFTYLYVMFQTKLKHACRRCRLLKLRCDKAKPICLRCLRDNRQCGYAVSERPWRPAVQQRRRNRTTSSEIPQHDNQIDPPRPFFPFWLPHNPSDTSNSCTDDQGISTVIRVCFSDFTLIGYILEPGTDQRTSITSLGLDTKSDSQRMYTLSPKEDSM